MGTVSSGNNENNNNKRKRKGIQRQIERIQGTERQNAWRKCPNGNGERIQTWGKLTTQRTATKRNVRSRKGQWGTNVNANKRECGTGNKNQTQRKNAPNNERNAGTVSSSGITRTSGSRNEMWGKLETWCGVVKGGGGGR